MPYQVRIMPRKFCLNISLFNYISIYRYSCNYRCLLTYAYTFYSHQGVATVNPNPTGALGSCGVDSPDSSFTVAISPYWMGQRYKGPNCGRKIVLTNTGPSTDKAVGGKGKVVVVTVKDTCEGCDENHLDLSVAAWNYITNNHAYSVVGINW